MNQQSLTLRLASELFTFNIRNCIINTKKEFVENLLTMNL